MLIETNSNLNVKDEVLTPKMVREILNLDNNQIEELCKLAAVKLKKDSKGLTYFTNDDVDVLKNYSVKSKSLQSKLALFHSKQQAVVSKEQIDNNSFEQLLQSLKNIEDAVTTKVASIMDEKLDGIDDVIIELIRAKSENETMRYKINELNKENYNLKNELSSYKNIAMNIYIKKAPRDNQLD